MYFSEKLNSPIDRFLAMSLYGVDPQEDPNAAYLVDIYPITPLPSGFMLSHYRKVDEYTYEAVPHCINIEEMKMIAVTRATGVSLSNLRTLLGAVATASEAQNVEGYFPVYDNEIDARIASSDNTANQQTVSGTTYWMPNAGVDLYYGDYDPNPEAE